MLLGLYPFIQSERHVFFIGIYSYLFNHCVYFLASTTKSAILTCVGTDSLGSLHSIQHEVELGWDTIKTKGKFAPYPMLHTRQPRLGAALCCHGRSHSPPRADLPLSLKGHPSCLHSTLLLHEHAQAGTYLHSLGPALLCGPALQTCS